MYLPQKSIPSNLEAEEAVLGSLIIDPDALAKVSTMLRPEDFFSEKNGMIYRVISGIGNQSDPVDYLTVVDRLEEEGLLGEVGGAAYITSLIDATPTAMHVESYAGIVEKNATLRRLISAAGQIATLAFEDNQDIDEVVDRAEQLIFGVAERRGRRDLTPVRALIGGVVDRLDYLHRHQGQLQGVPTGFTQLDKLLGGLQRSDLVILAARPSLGKTSLALNIALNAAKRWGQRVAFFSLEMSAEQLIQRLLSVETGIDQQKLRLGNFDEEEASLVMAAAGVLSDLQLFIDDTPAASAMEIRSKARRLQAEHGLDLVVVDYLQLMRGDQRSENRVQEISYISRTLKSLARELETPLLALSQLSRAVESRTDHRPQLSDLRESGAIEQDADIVMFIYREDKVKENSERQDIADIILAKHRNGPTGMVSLYFDERHTRFAELEVQRQYLG
jgi:replicative DNA helicase